MDSAHRRQEALQPPKSGMIDGTFPNYAPGAAERWYRQHKLRDVADRGLWHFTSAAAPPVGRFDLSSPRGTCYFASTPLAAVLELVGPDHAKKGWVPSGLMNGRVVSQIPAPGDECRLADMVNSHALKFGVTNEVTTTTRYEATGAWARQLDHAGYVGIRYRPRFTPGDALAFALFGEAGAPDTSPSADLSPVEVSDVVPEFGLKIHGPPDSSQVSILSP